MMKKNYQWPELTRENLFLFWGGGGGGGGVSVSTVPADGKFHECHFVLSTHPRTYCYNLL